MGRLEAIARSIVRAIVNGPKKRSHSPIALIIRLFSTIFSFYELPLHRHRTEVFTELCQDYWQLSDEEYVSSFRPDEGARPEDVLETMGDLGFSGSVGGPEALTQPDFYSNAQLTLHTDLLRNYRSEVPREICITLPRAHLLPR